MEITVKYSSYNKRRYSKPWIGKVVEWPANGYPKLEFGAYYGDDMGGEVAITANEGDLIRHGQKDFRGNHTTKDFYIVNPDGTLNNIDMAEARKYWVSKHQ
ncbi:MAG: hypothetical protein WC554_17295 [Clostridia bacterium]|jgi:hypothetical protein